MRLSLSIDMNEHLHDLSLKPYKEDQRITAIQNAYRSFNSLFLNISKRLNNMSWPSNSRLHIVCH